MKFFSIDKEKKKLRKVILKNVEGIDFDNHRLQGIFTITNVRFYTHDYSLQNLCQVDIKFEGKFKTEWQQSFFKRNQLYAKRRANEIFRRDLMKEVEFFLFMFSINTQGYRYRIKIGKIKWI